MSNVTCPSKVWCPECRTLNLTNSQFSSERTRVWEFAGLLYRPVGFTVSDRGSPRMINENWELRIGQISPEILDTKPRCPLSHVTCTCQITQGPNDRLTKLSLFCQLVI